MLLLVIVVPLAFAVIGFLVPSDLWRRRLVPIAGAAYLSLTMAALLWEPGAPPFGGWLRLDPLGRLTLLFLAMLFFLLSLYVPGYLAHRQARPNRIFCTGLLLFPPLMSVVCAAQHLGLLWVAIEANTLVAAPLLYFNHNARSLEATWKYLLIGSVGIAIALLGSFFLAYSALHAGWEGTLFFDDLADHAGRLSTPWLHAAFVLLFVGYGTKMGIAPMHTWKPDAYGEAPAVVGAILAGGLTTCAFLAILRAFRICAAAGEAAFAREIMIGLGLLSMAIAGVFMARQRDYKRMLAYSSVEHMGILVLGVGIGGAGVLGSLLHLLNNGFTKGVLFLSAGNIHRAFGSRSTDHVAGALRRLPVSAALFLAGFFAITGSPPFGPFVSELTILRAAVSNGSFAIAGAFVLLLFVVFVGMGVTVLAVVQGEPPARAEAIAFSDTPQRVLPILALLVLVTILGIYIPEPLRVLLQDAASFVEPTV